MPANIVIAKPVKATRRDCDNWGCGHFGASRGSLRHRGIDFVAALNDLVFAPIAGVVSRFGIPYSDPKKKYFRYVEIVASDGSQHRIMYVNPSKRLDIGSKVEAGALLGQAQNIAAYYRGMKNHVHYEIKKDGKYIDPDIYWASA